MASSPPSIPPPESGGPGPNDFRANGKASVMKALMICFAVAVGAGGVFGLMRLRAHRANLEKERAGLHRQHRTIESVREENKRLRAVAAQSERSDVNSADARQRELERLRRE